MPELDRRTLMVMAGLGVAAVAVPTPTAQAEPGPDAPPVPGPPDAATPPGFLGDEFDGPAGSAPNPALWSIAQRRELIKNPVFWDRPENMGQYRDDREHVFLDGNSNLVIRATRDGDGRYTSGKVVGNFGAPINHTFEARVKFNCLTPGAWPAWWLLNDNPVRGGEVDLAEWYGNMDWPSGTTVHARLDGTSFATMPGMEPYFEVPAFSIDDWPFNDPGYELRPVFNLAVGGSGGRDPRPGNYPADMLVDWVHIFPG